MKRFLWGFMLFANFAALQAQRDSVYIKATIQPETRTLTVDQEIVFTNKTGTPLSKIKLLNWLAAYKKDRTPLAYRKLEDRKTTLHFADKAELGETYELQIATRNNPLLQYNGADENIYIPLPEPLEAGKSTKISLIYKLRLPLSKFTGYGTDEHGQMLLKYFFIVPDGFESEAQSERFYLDIEENQNPGTYWTVNLNLPATYYSKSNLAEVQPNHFEGKLNIDPEFFIGSSRLSSIESTVDNQTVLVDFGYQLTGAERANLEILLPRQLAFIKNKTGFLPAKIFISDKFRRDEGFIGIDDIKFWKFHFRLFTPEEQTDLKYFSAISKKVVEQSAVYEKNEDHWMVNGLKTYLEIRYIDSFYKDKKLLGDLPEDAKIFGLKPLKIFHASKLKLSERYGLAYQYMMTQNLDQAIDIPFNELSNFNALAISHFESGSLLAFIAEKMGEENFSQFLRSYFAENRNSRPLKKDFLDKLSVASAYSADFLEPFVQHKNRVNFNLKRYSKKEDEFLVKIKKNTTLPVPFKIETVTEDNAVKTFWFDTDHLTKTDIYRIPQADASKIVLNSDYIFPEMNFRDNYRYTKGFFANTKKIRFKFFKDIPNPEYNEIYLNPRVTFNAYDKVLAGLNFQNTSFFQRKFRYSVTPYFSSGTGKLTGSGGVSYTFQPAESFYRSLTFGVSASHFHYDYDLTYRKISAEAGFNFSKNPRSDIGRSLGFSYNYFEKDLNPMMLANNEYEKYNLWNVGYGYSDRRVIHEKYLGANVQWMEDFQKISAEALYRFEFADDQKISLRFFGGYFLSNKTKNNLFDYGISRVSNYAFSYGLLGQSATSGVLAQQYILAEGGFKSYVGNTANQWIGAVNVDTHVWRWFNVYADAGVYKNKHQTPEFIWDSGIKVKVIPDFLEVYFPMQSSLGFEPSFKDYAQRIRFTLVLNFGAVTDYFRRGWF